jgi:hypothetical protein
MNQLTPAHECPELELLNDEGNMVIVSHAFMTPEGPKPTHSLIISNEGRAMFGVQMDFCPFCGTELSGGLRLGATRIGKPKNVVINDYLTYRQHFVKLEREGHPLGQDKWDEYWDSWQEVNLLLPHAKPAAAKRLFKQKQELRETLCLSLSKSSNDVKKLINHTKQLISTPQVSDSVLPDNSSTFQGLNVTNIRPEDS